MTYRGGQYVYAPADMSGWLKTLFHKPLKALAQAVPVAAAFIPGVGGALTKALGANAAAAIKEIGTSQVITAAVSKLGVSSVQPLVAATLAVNGTDPTQANIDAATAQLIAYQQANGLLPVTTPATTLSTMTLDQAISKYWMYGAGGLLLVALLLRR
jgi:hypothetical protein